MVGVYDRVRAWPAVADGRVQGAGDQARGLGAAGGPADYAAGKGVQDHGAVHLSFPCGVLGDIGDPQLIGLRPGELPVHQVGRGGRLVLRAAAPVTGQALNPGQAHQPPGGAANGDAQPQG